MLDKKGYAGAILMDYSKTFDTINHEHLVAKLNVYGFSKEALKIFLATKKILEGKKLISRKPLNVCGVPQGSVLEAILFHLYLNKLFLFLNEIDISNFADDTTPSVYQKNLAELLEKLERNS